MSIVPSQPSGSLDEIVAGLCKRLREGLAQATRARAEELIDDFQSAMRGELGSRSFRSKVRQAHRERRRVLVSLTKQLLREIEKLTRAHVRESVRRVRQERKQAAAQAAAAARREAGTAASGQRRARRQPVRPPPPPLDPEQIKRDLETQRLRALLRPVAEEVAPPPAPVAPPPPPVVQQPPTTPGGFLRGLEKEIQEAVPYLGKLGPERCGAQIAAWTGQVRQFRDQLPGELFSAMRPAIRIFLEHLTELRAAMEASFVDALEPKWHPPSWPDYIEANRARAEGRPPRLSTDRLVAYHHAMLRALVLPHRKSVRDQAPAIIDAAAEALPPDDGLLRSARRRHAERENKRTGEWATPDSDDRGRWQPSAEAAQDGWPTKTTAAGTAALDAHPEAGQDDAAAATDLDQAMAEEPAGDFAEAFPPAANDTGVTPDDETDEAAPGEDTGAEEKTDDESEFAKLWTKE